MRMNIRNMVCRHCVTALSDILDRLAIAHGEVGIGYAEIEEGELSPDSLKRLDTELAAAGFERVVSTDDLLVDKVKLAVLHHVRDQEECHYNLSACIEKHVGVAYDTLSRIFSQNEGCTIERYHIAQKVERVKELLGYKELTLAEIAFRTGYSSAAHLSRQFKSETGVTPTEYIRSLGGRKPLNEV